MSKIDTINLLPTASSLNISQQKLAKQLKKVAIVFIVFSILFSAGTFGYQFWLKNQKSDLLVDKKKLNESMSQFNTEVEVQQKLRYRLKLVSNLLSSRVKNSERLDQIWSVLPEDISLKEIKIKGNSVEIKGVLKEIAQIKELEDNVALARREGKYSKIRLGSLNATVEGWPFSIELVEK